MRYRRHIPWKIILVEVFATLMTSALTYGYLIGKFVWSRNMWWVILVTILFAYITRPIVQVYLSLIVLIATRVRIIPRIDFSGGIPAKHRTALVYCVRATSEAAIDLAIKNLQKSARGNPDPNMYAIYLSDTSDPKLVTREIAAIRVLQDELGQGRVFLFHRDTHWGKKWGGYQDLMSWLTTGHNTVQYYTDPSYKQYRRSPLQKLFGFSCLKGEASSDLLSELEISNGIIGSFPRSIDKIPLQISYLLISDVDVVWPKGAAIRTVEKMAHPANDEFSIFQPSVGIGNGSATLFTRMLSWGRQFGEFIGLSTWKIYDAYLFFGKGGIKIKDYMETMMIRGSEVLNPNLLSHDFVEARYLRTAYLPDIRVSENAPLDYLDDIARMKRWFLGDMLALCYEYVCPPAWIGRRRFSHSPVEAKLRPLPFVGHSLTHLVIDYDFVPLAFSVFMMLMVLANCISGIYLIADAGAEIGVLSVVLAGIFLGPKVLGPIASSIHLRRPISDALRAVRYGLPELILSTVLFLQHLVDRIEIVFNSVRSLWRFLLHPSEYPLKWEPSSVNQQSGIQSMSWAGIYWKQKTVVITGVALVILLVLTHEYRGLWYMCPFWISFVVGPAIVYITGKRSNREQG